MRATETSVIYRTVTKLPLTVYVLNSGYGVKTEVYHWVGARKVNGRLQWVDGSTDFSHVHMPSFPDSKPGDCAIVETWLDDRDITEKELSTNPFHFETDDCGFNYVYVCEEGKFETRWA